MSGLILSPDQEHARDAAVAHLRGETGELLTIGGLAGTGKTTIMKEAVRALGPSRPRLAACAYSGKAASVMRAKLTEAGVLKETDYCGTIHGLVYDLKGAWLKRSEKARAHEPAAPRPGIRTPLTEKIEMDMAFEAKGAKGGYGAVLLDEASMVDKQAFQDLSDLGLPIVAFGDHGQLPPVNSSFNLMEKPMIRLEKIHRQAEKSPIIQLSMMAREDGYIPVGEYGPGVRKIRTSNSLEWSKELTRDWIMLCARNATRIFWNDRLRAQYGFTSHDPMPGERVICLKNNRDWLIFNGMMGELKGIQHVPDHWYKVAVDMGDQVFHGECLSHQFGSQSTLYEYPPARLRPEQIGNLFDWAWCITAHKSQGSEFRRVCVLEERMGDMELWKKWLYTTVTRAQEELLIVGSS